MTRPKRPKAWYPPRRRLSMETSDDLNFKDVTRGLNTFVTQLNRTVTVLPRMIRMFERIAMLGIGAVGMGGISKFGQTGSTALGAGAGAGATGMAFRSSQSWWAAYSTHQAASAGRLFAGEKGGDIGASSAAAWFARGKTSEWAGAGAGAGLKGAVGGAVGAGKGLLMAAGGGSLGVGLALTGFGAALIAATVVVKAHAKSLTDAANRQNQISTSLVSLGMRGDVEQLVQRSRTDITAYQAYGASGMPDKDLPWWGQGGRGAKWIGRQIARPFSSDPAWRAGLNQLETEELAREKGRTGGLVLEALSRAKPTQVGFSGFEEAWKTMASQLAGKTEVTVLKDILKEITKITIQGERTQAKILGTPDPYGALGLPF